MMDLIQPYKNAVFGLLALALLALTGLGFWRGMATLDAMLAAVRLSALNERDAQWKAEIAVSNEKAANAAAEQAINAAAAEGAAQMQIAALTDQLSELEAANAALPDGYDCGLDRKRVRLLDAP